MVSFLDKCAGSVSAVLWRHSACHEMWQLQLLPATAAQYFDWKTVLRKEREPGGSAVGK